MTASGPLTAGDLTGSPAFVVPGVRSRAPAVIGAALIAVTGLVSLWLLRAPGNQNDLAPSLVLGALFGIVLQRSRFCFLCHTRDFVTTRDASGVVAILLSIAVGSLGYAVVFGAWLPDPSAGRLPPDAHIGPAGPVLLLASLVFGLGMAISGSCISGHLYRLGEGSPTAPFALLGTVAGFMLGFETWNALYVLSVSDAPVGWLPRETGYPAWLGIQLALLAVVATAVAFFAKPAPPPVSAGNVLSHALHRIFVARWPAAVGGAAVGVLGAVAYFQVQPLGVTAAIGSLARGASAWAGVLPETLHGLDGFAGCRTVLATWMSPNAVFVIALAGASFAAALTAGQFRPERPSRRHVVNGLAGGVLLGWGAMTAIGCTVGTLLSGTMAGAVSGWVFLAGCLLGVVAGLRTIARLSQPGAA